MRKVLTNEKLREIQILVQGSTSSREQTWKGLIPKYTVPLHYFPWTVSLKADNNP